MQVAAEVVGMAPLVLVAPAVLAAQVAVVMVAMVGLL